MSAVRPVAPFAARGRAADGSKLVTWRTAHPVAINARARVMGARVDNL